jgi:glutamine amidotransferase
MIGIIDYGSGNIKAFARIYGLLGLPFVVVTKTEDLNNVTRLVLPGVGAFDHVMSLLEKTGIRQALDDLVRQRHIPVLGICAGMQIMAHSSEEGRLRGLAWIDGVVKKCQPSELAFTTRLPHMGWNSIAPVKESDLFRDLDLEARFYFLHSYCFHCQPADRIAVTDYGGKFTSAVSSGNVFGVQFHPEKSHQWGIQLLKNFAHLSS